MRLVRSGAGAVLLVVAAATTAAAQSSQAEWLAARTQKQDRHHHVSLQTKADPLTIIALRFVPDTAGNLVAIGETRNDSMFGLSYARLTFAFFDATGRELGREWTYVHGGVTARILAPVTVTIEK